MVPAVNQHLVAVKTIEDQVVLAERTAVIQLLVEMTNVSQMVAAMTAEVQVGPVEGQQLFVKTAVIQVVLAVGQQEAGVTPVNQLL